MEENFNSALESTQLESPVVEAKDPSALPPINIDDPEITKFFGYLPGDAIDTADREQMKFIWNYFAEGSKSAGEVIRKISQAERHIEPPKEGETRLGKFYMFVSLLNEERSLQNEISAYRR